MVPHDNHRLVVSCTRAFSGSIPFAFCNLFAHGLFPFTHGPPGFRYPYTQPPFRCVRFQQSSRTWLLVPTSTISFSPCTRPPLPVLAFLQSLAHGSSWQPSPSRLSHIVALGSALSFFNWAAPSHRSPPAHSCFCALS